MNGETGSGSGVPQQDAGVGGKERIAVTISPAALMAVDRVRGVASRSAFLETAAKLLVALLDTEMSAKATPGSEASNS